MTDEVQDPEEQDAATNQEGQHYFRGQRIEPFNWARYNAVQRLMKAELSNAEMTAAIVYLSTIPSSEANAVRGAEARAKFLVRVEEWVTASRLANAEGQTAIHAEADRIYSEYVKPEGQANE
jgi:hypothetical protein